MPTTKQQDFKEAVKELMKLLKLDKPDIMAIYVYSIFSGLLYLALPLGIQFIVGFIMAGSISTSAIILMIVILITLSLNGLLQIKQFEIIEKIEQKLFVRYSFRFAESLASIDLLKMDSYYLPELVNRFFEVSTLQKSIYKLLIDVPAAAVQIILGTLLLSLYHPLFIGFGFLLLTLVTFIIWATSTRGLQSAINTSNLKFETGAWMEEMARNGISYKFNKGSDFHMRKTDELVASYLDSKTAHFRILKIQYGSLISFKIIIVAVMLILGIALLVNQEINIGQFIAADIVIIAIIGSVEKFIASFDTLYDALTSQQKLEKVTQAAMERQGNMEYKSNKRGPAIELQNVSFSYENNFNVIKDFTLNMAPEQWVVLNGKKGSGKSSIINLLSGSYADFGGNILINKIPIGNYHLGSLRSHIGVLLQNSNVFKGSLLENVTYSKEVSSMDTLQELASLTGLAKYVHDSRNGWDQIIDTYTRKIPSPFMHSILLTRALYNQPDLLLLEDPFIYLDGSERDRLVKYVKEKMKSTVLIVNNQFQSLDFCDYSITM